MTPARCMRNLQLLPKIGVTYVYTAGGRRQKMFTAVSNMSGLVKESAYLTNLSPGVDWLALTEEPRLQHRHNTKNMWVSSRVYGGVYTRISAQLSSP